MAKMTIPWHTLSDEALTGLIEEFVTREGTEYGFSEVDLSAKVVSVKNQLSAGTALIVFDGETQSCSIASYAALKKSDDM
jgi:uncharacterized protein YheU (UPF0270 family)